jgi:hypothetical protein
MSPKIEAMSPKLGRFNTIFLLLLLRLWRFGSRAAASDAKPADFFFF